MTKPLKSFGTSVAVSKSQEQIRILLAKFGASKASFEDDFKTGTQILRFEYSLKEGMTVPINFAIAIKKIYEHIRPKRRRSRTYKSDDYYFEQAKKIAWRHIFDWVKANLNLIEFGLTSFENIFLSYFSRVLEDGSYKTLGDIVLPQLYSGEFFNKLLPEGKKNSDNTKP